MEPEPKNWEALFPPTFDGAAGLQRRLARVVVDRDEFSPPRLVGGADLSYDRSSGLFLAAVVCLDGKSGALVEVGRHVGRIAFPYVPGFLSMREGPGLIRALEGMRHRPDLLICDGHGRAHPRRLGLASHVGVALDLPTIGVAKSRLTGRHREPGARRGCSVALVDGEEIIGRVVRTRTGVRPVFVSVGHRVSLRSAVRICLKWARPYRLPEPTRLAHGEVSGMRRDLTRTIREPPGCDGGVE